MGFLSGICNSISCNAIKTVFFSIAHPPPQVSKAYKFINKLPVNLMQDNQIPVVPRILAQTATHTFCLSICRLKHPIKPVAEGEHTWETKAMLWSNQEVYDSLSELFTTLLWSACQVSWCSQQGVQHYSLSDLYFFLEGLFPLFPLHCSFRF